VDICETIRPLAVEAGHSGNRPWQASILPIGSCSSRKLSNLRAIPLGIARSQPRKKARDADVKREIYEIRKRPRFVPDELFSCW
jgi:hypothetical protein